MIIDLREETRADWPAIEAVIAAAFLSARRPTPTEQYIVEALRRAGQLTISLVAELDDTVIGHVAVSPVTISDGTSGWFGLGPVAVLPQHQYRGVGSQLVREALTILREQGAAGCVVLGEPRYYGRFGFQGASSLVLPGVPPEYFQSIAFGSSTVRGSVTYHEAFNLQS